MTPIGSKRETGGFIYPGAEKVWNGVESQGPRSKESPFEVGLLDRFVLCEGSERWKPMSKRPRVHPLEWHADR
jgi:hypothetical protein